MMNRLTAVCLLLALLDFSKGTPLDDYVNAPDPTFSYQEIAVYNGSGYVSYVLNMTSQTWLDQTVTDHPVWWHYLIFTVPDVVKYNDSAFLMIDNGNLDEPTPHPDFNGRINSTIFYAQGMEAVAADLMFIPNQPVYCQGDDVGRTRREDDLIAYTWRRYVDEIGTNPDILLRLPMVKATIRAMDAMRDHVATVRPEINLQHFMLSGGSKRGWTTYLAAAVAPTRVFAIVPSVLSCLNFVAVMNHQYQAYGGWSFSNKDYWLENLTAEINEPGVQMMMEIVDPYAYRDRLTMPKLIVSAVQDEHFMPDDSWYFWDDLVGSKYYWMLEDSGHGIAEKHQAELKDNRINFFHFNKNSNTLPELSWIRSENATHGILTLTTDTAPSYIMAFWGDTNNGTERDFRQFIGVPDPSSPTPNPITWSEDPVEDLGGGVYQATYAMPATGHWRCFFMKMRFEILPGQFLYTSTETNIIPDILPFPKCSSPAECQGELL